MIKPKKERLTPIEDLKKVLIGPQYFQVTKLETYLFKVEEEELVTMSRRNIDLFAWTPADMLGINAIVVCHQVKNIYN